jgi:cysteine desulfurase
MAVSEPIYLDYQATTPLAPEARLAMLPYLESQFGNPHSAHAMGRVAAAAVELARDRVASLLPSDGRTFFTSGATEAINWAIKGSMAPGKVLAVSAIEHAAVLDTAAWLGGQGVTVVTLPVNAEGLIDVDKAAGLLPKRVDLMCVMQVNNEIGTIQPVAELAALAHARGGLLLCDAVQAYGRLAAPVGADMIAISAHKIHGPKGIGALWLRDGVRPEPLLHGGGQQGGLRSGTLAPALCAGFGVAAALAAENVGADEAHICALADHLWARLGDGWKCNGSRAARWPGNLNISQEGVDIARLMSDVRGVMFSAGSACASGSGRPSHVLQAIGLPVAAAKSSIRLGLGRYTTMEQVERAADLINDAVHQQRQWGA